MAIVHPNVIRSIRPNVTSNGTIISTEPDSQPYDEWLMELVIKHGIGQPIRHPGLTWGKLSAAEAIGHVVVVHGETVVTPKAKRYLEIVAIMEERVT
jgi:hypothetical protein